MRFSKIFRIRLGSRILASKIQFWNEELHTHYGITNEVPESNHLVIPFWDFIEDIPVRYVFASLRTIQRKFGLGDIFVVQTKPKKSYRAVCFTMVDWFEYISLLSGTQYIDPSYLRHSVMRGRAVIRITEKNGTKDTVIKILDGYPYDIQSKHHRAFLSTIYPQIPKDFHPPNPIQVRVSKYESFR